MRQRHSSTVTVTENQLPFWPADVRGLPNAFARSALFNVANARKGARDNYKRRSIATVKGASITYTGEELRQDDEDVAFALGPTLSNDEARLDGFSQAHFVSQDDALGQGALEGEQRRIHLVGVQVYLRVHKRAGQQVGRIRAHAAREEPCDVLGLVWGQQDGQARLQARLPPLCEATAEI